VRLRCARRDKRRGCDRYSSHRRAFLILTPG
jgi:hypothetical protein